MAQHSYSDMVYLATVFSAKCYVGFMQDKLIWLLSVAISLTEIRYLQHSLISGICGNTCIALKKPVEEH